VVAKNHELRGAEGEPVKHLLSGRAVPRIPSNMEGVFHEG